MAALTSTPRAAKAVTSTGTKSVAARVVVVRAFTKGRFNVVRAGEPPQNDLGEVLLLTRKVRAPPLAALADNALTVLRYCRRPSVAWSARLPRQLGSRLGPPTCTVPVSGRGSSGKCCMHTGSARVLLLGIVVTKLDLPHA